MATRAPPPGHDWLAIISRPTLDEFARAFAAEPVLEASVLRAPIAGAPGIHAVFEATRGMYDRIAFVTEHRAYAWVCLEWEGLYRGEPIAGATILIRDRQDAIERVRLLHRPLGQLVAFAADLRGRLGINDA